MQQLLERYALPGATSAMFPLLPPSFLGTAGATGSLHPLLGVPVLRTPADLLAQQYLSSLAAAAAAQAPATSVPSSASINDHSISRSVSCLSPPSMCLNFYLAPGRGAKYCNRRVCLSVCLLAYFINYTSKFHQIIYTCCYT